MEIDMNKEHWTENTCPKYDCRKNSCKCGLKKVFLAAILGDDSKDSPIAPKNGEYCNAIVVYEANGHIYIYSQEGIPTLVESEGSNVEEIIEQLEGRLDQEVLDRQAADNVLQGEIDDIKNSPDVVDIVATYAALQAYDTSKLGDNDIVRVLQDEQHDGQSTYYRWNKQSSTWTYIGAVGDYYTKGQVDTLLADKQDELTAGANISIAQVDNDLVISATDTTYTAGTNISISSGNVISATDTTYNNFVGTDGQTAGTAGLVPAPATTDADKFLKSDGTWATAGGGGGVTPVQTTGTSTTDVMSQDATTKMLFPDFADFPGKVAINSNISADSGLAINGSIETSRANNIVISPNPNAPARIGSGGRSDNIVIGNDAGVFTGSGNVVIGKSANGSGSINTPYNVVIGNSSTAQSKNHCVALGCDAQCTRDGEVNIGTGSNGTGYNSTNYRVLGGVHDPIDAHDAATKGYVDSIVINYATLTAAGAPTTSTAATSVGQLYYDSTNDDYYYCSAIDTTDPNNPVYTWSALSTGGGGGDTVYSTVTTSNASDGGAVYIGPLNASQQEQPDPTTTDNHRRYFWALPFDTSGNPLPAPGNSTINIGGVQSGGGESNVTLGYATRCVGGYNTLIGTNATSDAYGSCTSIGQATECHSNYSVALGRGSVVSANNVGSIALGAGAETSRAGEINVGTKSSYNYASYNNTGYRVIGGVHDGQGLHDCATVAQGNTLSASAPDSSTVGVLGQLWTDTTSMHTYQCTAISGSTYTWTQRW